MVKFAYFLLIFISFGQILFAQNILDRITLKIGLQALPTIEEVGFKNPKNSWKVKYALRIIDEETLNNNSVPLEKINFKAKYKKIGVFIAKGNFNRNQLQDDGNRIYSSDVIFDDKIKQLLTSGKPYVFLFRVQSKVKSNLSRKKLENVAEFQVNADNEVLLVIKTIGVTITIEKETDNGFSHSIFID